MLLANAKKIAEGIKEDILDIKGVKQVEICGGIRRYKPEVKDIDILVVGKSSIMFEIAKLGDKIRWQGEKKLAFIEKECGMQVDINRIKSKAHIGAMMLFMTGPGKLNIVMRIKAKKRGMKLNQYGLWRDDVLLSDKEDDIFGLVGMQWMSPYTRELFNVGRIARKYKVQSSSNPLKYYIIRVDEFEHKTCTCLGFRYRGKCKHLEEV